MIAEDDRSDGLRTLTRPGLPSVVFEHLTGDPGRAGIVYLAGFGSSGLDGAKAVRLAAIARRDRRSLLRFDYSGHGRSAGRRDERGFSAWLDEATTLFDAETHGPQILVGSSMGGFLALRLALARLERVAALVLVAPAVDFLLELVWPAMADAERDAVERGETVTIRSPYLADGVMVTKRLVEDSRHLRLLDGPIALDRPVRILHGCEDGVIPWRHSLRVMDMLGGTDVRVTLVKDGDHRLSRPADLDLLDQTLAVL